MSGEWKQRVVDELDELNAKIDKLTSYFTTQSYKHLHVVDQSLLRDQHETMKQYAEILRKRIARFSN